MDNKGFDMDMIKEAMQHAFYNDTLKEEVNTSMPLNPTSSNELLLKLKEWSKHETKLWNGEERLISGGVYHGQKDLMDLQTSVYGLFNITNPLHPSQFPFVRKMMSEIIAMTISYFNGSCYDNCGLLTSGGTESICVAVRAYKYAWIAKNENRKNFNRFSAELIIPKTAHAAFFKACEMYEINVVVIDVNPNTYRANISEMNINQNTIAIIGSSPDYAHGVMDDINAMSEFAFKNGIGFHVDCCLGSYLLPTLAKMEKYKNEIPPFDFRCRGVTSISCDTHKFGYATKGTSVLMFRDKSLRRRAYFCLNQSTIGLYATPTIQGSRNGAVIACAWTVMMHLGQNGYINEAMRIMESVEIIKDAFKSDVDINEYIEIMGNPSMSVIAWTMKEKYMKKGIHVYWISDEMKTFGWSLNNCKDPDCTHICVTRANSDAVKQRFVDNLKVSIRKVIENKDQSKYKQSGSAIYGTIIKMDKKELSNDYAFTYLDVLHDLPPKHQSKL